jgi:hypothetical protein
MSMSPAEQAQHLTAVVRNCWDEFAEQMIVAEVNRFLNQKGLEAVIRYVGGLNTLNVAKVELYESILRKAFADPLDGLDAYPRPIELTPRELVALADLCNDGEVTDGDS